MLQGRLFSYPDTHYHRLGKNYDQLPINCPYRARVAHYSRDGWATVNGNHGAEFNYEPNSNPNAPKEEPECAWSKYSVSGEVGRYKNDHPNTHYEQPNAMWNKVFTDTDRAHWISNMAGPLGAVTDKSIQEGMLTHFYRIDPDMGDRMSKAIGV